MLALDVLLALLAVGLAIPCLVMLVECAAASPVSAYVTPTVGDRPRVAVLIPAHNEELGIGDTVAALRAGLGPHDSLLVVADNCTDRTAELAVQSGAEVVCRVDERRRGKGYALAYGVESLSRNPPDVVIVVDADCRVAEGGIERLAVEAVRLGRPVQAEYLLHPAGQPDTKTAISALALIVRNRVRPRGLHRLGLPCPLTGSGMAFPWRLLHEAPALKGNLVEDMVLGIELALRGAAPVSCPTVQVRSQLPPAAADQMTQRRRWESGHLQTLWTYGPRLLWTGLRRARLDLISMALDLMVPPLALLVMLLIGAGAISALCAVLGGWTAPLFALGGGTICLVVAVGIAWYRFARKTLPLRTLAGLPLYLTWKVPLYAAHLFHRAPRLWVRTGRTGERNNDRVPKD